MKHDLPQPSRLVLTDGGLETDLIYNRGVELPCFASVMLLSTAEGREALEAYFRSHLDLAERVGLPFELVSASWRASPDWAPEFGIGQDELDDLNRRSVRMLLDLRAEREGLPITVTGCIGPRGDGYDAGKLMTAEEAERYHARQVSVLAGAGAEAIGAMTMTNVPEAIGIARAAQALDVPAYISFTVETDGRLPTGDTLGAAVSQVDEATGGYPSFYMINCAHPTHFMSLLDPSEPWTGRLGGIRANASRCSHAELDAMTELDAGDPHELGQLYREIRSRLPNLHVLGGCCGTDVRHIESIAGACAAQEVLAA